MGYYDAFEMMLCFLLGFCVSGLIFHGLDYKHNLGHGFAVAQCEEQGLVLDKVTSDDDGNPKIICKDVSELKSIDGTSYTIEIVDGD